MKDHHRPRENQSRDNQARDERPRQESASRDDRSTEDRPREDRPRREREPRVVREDPPEALTLSLDMLPPAIAIPPMADLDEPVAPKRRGRPKKIVDEVPMEG